MHERIIKRKHGDDALFLYETKFVRKDGITIPLEVSSSLVETETNNPEVLVIARDITERIKTQETLLWLKKHQ